MRRRDALGALAGALLPLPAAGAEALPPVRAITRGPRFHWFGYYDKWQFDPASRYALGCSNDFEHRLPTADDVIRLGMVDLEDKDRWIELGESRSWSWHQTCMLQWMPGSRDEILWNDREGDRFVCRVLNVRTRRKRTLPAPIYALSPDARWAISTDFRRLYHVRPETGYAGISDPNKDVAAPGDTGIWRMNMTTGKTELLVSYADAVRVPDPKQDWTGAVHWFNHLLYSPDGSRFVFLHRWRKPDQGRGFSTRLFTADADGSGLRLVHSYGRTSHFNWRDAQVLLIWMDHPSHGPQFYLLDVITGKADVLDPENLPRDGHCSFLPSKRWIVSDTSPDEQRLQHPYLYDTRTRRRVPLGHFHSPPDYTGVWRCDTTPRYSPDGKKVIFDSPHGGNGRQMYLADVSGIVG